MSYSRSTLAVTVTATLVALAVAGCSSEKESAASKLPDRSCWGVFSRSDLEPLIGPGQEVKEKSPIDLRLNAVRRAATCTIEVDGQVRVMVTATRQPLGTASSGPH